MNAIASFPNVVCPKRNCHNLTKIGVLLLPLFCNSSFGATPTLVSITANPVGTEVYLRYSEPLCPSPFSFNVGSTHIPNYTLTPPATIAAATLLADQQTVRLDFAPALNGAYNLQVATLPTFGIFDCGGTNQLVTPVTMPFTVNGSLGGPVAYYTTATSISTDCGGTITVHGAGFDSTATIELIPGSIPGATPSVNPGGTTITATFPSGIAPGAYSVVVKNPPSATLFPGQSATPYAIQVLPVTIQTSWPHFFGGCSSVNVTARGGGFCPGATFNAVPTGGGPAVPVSGIVISPGGDQISATFDFSSASGNYDLIVQNPSGGSSATTVTAIYSIGMYAWQVYPNRVGNCGIENIQISGSFCTSDLVQLVPNGAGAIISGTVSSIVPNLYGGGNMTAGFNFAGATPGVYQVEVKRGAGPWVVTGLLVTVVSTAPCPVDVEIVGRHTVGYTVVNTFSINVRNLSCAPVPASTLILTVPPSATPTLSAATMGGVISPANVITYAIPALNPSDLHQVQFNMLLPTIGTAISLSAAISTSGCGPVLHPITVVASQDPNSKTGLAGIGPNHYIVGNETLPYEIHFENIPSATAPAQDVFINDRFNPTHFDLSTFSLGDITFGNQVITPPPGLTTYSDVVPFDMDGNPATTADQLLLVIDAHLITNPAAPDYGRVTWSYRSLDPATLSTPGNPLLGFLPPNQFPPLGEGSVKFTVKLQPGLTFGTQFGSAAVIIFDQNAPIFTNPWFNEISPPIALSITNNLGQIEISWGGAPGSWILEETPQLEPPIIWATVPTTPVSISGGRQQVMLEPLAEKMFFRLRR